MCSHVICLEPIHFVTCLLINFPQLLSLVTLLICSLYNLLVFAVPFGFVAICWVVYVLCPALSSSALSSPAQPSPALPCPALPCPSLPCPALPCPALPFPALPCPSLPCPALPCPALPCPALPCPACQSVFPLWGCFCLFCFIINKNTVFPPAIGSSLSSLPPTLTETASMSHWHAPILEI